MFGINYLKTGPTQYVIQYQGGRIKRSGPGLAFFYYKPSASISVVPIGSDDVPFIFNEITVDFQPVAVQGQLTYRITDPESVASLLDYSIDGAVEQYASDDHEKLSQRLVNLVQVATRAELRGLTLRQAIQGSDEVASGALARVSVAPALVSLGVEILELSILAIKPSPETVRALEAEAREALLRQADEAIYERRNAAVEQERRIKENELNTELAVETKQRQLREAKVDADQAVEVKRQQIRELKMAGEIRLETERQQHVAVRSQNSRLEADDQAYAIEASLRPLQALDDDTRQLLAMQSAEPRLMITQALKDIAQNASKIGQLNISPDLMDRLLREDHE